MRVAYGLNRLKHHRSTRCGVSFGRVPRVSSPTEDEPDEPLLCCSASVASTSVSLLLTGLDRMALASGPSTLSVSPSPIKPSLHKMRKGVWSAKYNFADLCSGLPLDKRPLCAASGLPLENRPLCAT